MLLPYRRPWLLTSLSPVACRALAGFLIVAAAALHVAYLACDCPLDLSPDEAHYWDWSRHLDWSYYSKGPLIAYVIRAGCELFGPLSLALTGNLMLAVRLPAVLFGALLLVGVYQLAKDSFDSDRFALAAVALALTLPVVSLGASLMTIDAPYTCCWCWGLVFLRQAIFRGSRWAWGAAGLTIGVGCLAKYTMIILLPSAGLYLLFSPEHRRFLFRPGFWVMSALAGLCCLPILYWNWANDWVTFRHVRTLAAEGDTPWSVWGPFTFIAGQALVLLGSWFAVWVAAMLRWNPLRRREPSVRFLWWTSLTVWLVFFAFSPKNGGGEINWPVTAYLSGLILAGRWLAEIFAGPPSRWQSAMRWGVGLTSALGLAVTLFLHESDYLYPAFAQVAPEPTAAAPYPLRRVDPSCRLRGYRTLAARVDELREELRRETGEEPVLAGLRWNMPGELGVYCAGHPQAYSLGLRTGDRHSQYDLWHNPIDDPEAFRGKTFIIVGSEWKELVPAFESIEVRASVQYSCRGQPVSGWDLLVARGYKGFPPDPKKTTY